MSLVAAPTRLDLPFWGSRDYVHGSHLVHDLLARLGTDPASYPASITAEFHRPLPRQGLLVPFPDRQALRQALPEPYAVFAVALPRGKQILGLDDSGMAVDERVPDDEAELLRGADLDLRERRARARNIPPQRLVAGLTALTKALHRELFPDQEHGPWFAARIDLRLTALPDQACDLELAVDRAIGNKMTSSSFTAGDLASGTIYFNRIRRA